jgi:hypothetical protein
MCEFIIQFFESEKHVKFDVLFGLNEKDNYLNTININESKFLISVVNNEKRLNIFSNYNYEFKVKPMLNLYISFLDSYWQNIYFEIPSDKIKNEYKQLLIYGKDCTDETRYTKDRILELTYNFVINYK